MADDSIPIPHAQLHPETLRALVEEFITREGTDYGEVETPLEKKVEAIMKQLRAGKVAIFFDPSTETCNIVPVEEWKKKTVR